MRRIRLLLAVLAIGLFGSLFAASPASADLGDDEQCMVDTARERLGLAEDAELTQAQLNEAMSEQGAADAFMQCHEAPNPLVPALYEVFWGAFGLAVVMLGMWKFALPAMRKTLDARADRIRNDLESAESQRLEAEGILGDYRAQLADAKTESARIIEEARQTADDMKQQLAAKAQSDIADMRTQAAADIEAAKAQAIADLRGEVATLAIGAAEQGVGRNLDQDTNVALVEAYINQVGAKS